MNNIIKYCLLSVLFMSFSTIGFALDQKSEECPVGQFFDKDKGACVVKDAVPAVESKDEAPVMK